MIYETKKIELQTDIQKIIEKNVTNGLGFKRRYQTGIEGELDLMLHLLDMDSKTGNVDLEKLNARPCPGQYTILGRHLIKQDSSFIIF